MVTGIILVAVGVALFVTALYFLAASPADDAGWVCLICFVLACAAATVGFQRLIDCEDRAAAEQIK